MNELNYCQHHEAECEVLLGTRSLEIERKSFFEYSTTIHPLHRNYHKLISSFTYNHLSCVTITGLMNNFEDQVSYCTDTSQLHINITSLSPHVILLYAH